jgi:hypothetical protein
MGQLGDSSFVRLLRYTASMAEKWCTVTVTDAEGRRHSVDVQAVSTYDAAHIYVTHAKAQPGAGIPPLTLASVLK